MSELIGTLTSLLPAPVLRRYAADPAPLRSPEAERFPGAVLFADISGFTTLAESMADAGPAGVEQLSSLLNTYFGKLIDLVGRHGGDVIEFAGDGLLALWPAVPGDATSLPALRAAQCALEVQGTLHDFEVAPRIRLSLRVAISDGEVLVAHVGGVADRWEFLAAGAPFVALGETIGQARPGEVVVAQATWRRVASRCVGRPLPGGAIRLETLRAPVEHGVAAHLALGPQAEGALSAYVPRALLERLTAGQADWVGELRRITVLFLNVRGLEHGDLDGIQQAVAAVQRVVNRHGGTINKLLVDDKGTVVVVAFGLPPRVHEDDAGRAVRAGLALRAELGGLGLSSGIGVATGQVFCGLVGDERRREYTILGDVVNLAARLMQAAGEGILVDGVTRGGATLGFTPQPPLAMKGKSLPIVAYRPDGARGSSAPVAGDAAEGVGRVDERSLLGRLLTRVAAGETACALLEGEAGIGKSHLAGAITAAARARGLVVAAGAAEESIPYHAWREVMMGLYPEVTGADALRELLPADLVALAPLVAPFFALTLPDGELTAGMSGQVRADNTHAVAVKLLAQAAARGPLAIVLEDGHRLDSPSWALAALAARQVRPLLLLIAARTVDDAGPAALLLETRPERLRLAPLQPDEAAALVCRRLGVTSVPPAVQALVQDKAGGHPLFTVELAHSLRDTGIVMVEGGEARLVGDPAAARLPTTIEGTITARLDRLAPDEQMTLKVASVAGPRFTPALLRAIHPIEADHARLDEILAGVVRAGFVAADGDGTFRFRHTMTEDVAYRLMLFTQRQRLHRAAAEWLEGHAPETPPVVLARHRERAGDVARAVLHLERAGELALRAGAHLEAAGIFERALELEPQAAPARRARWERRRGDARFGLGALPAASESMGRCLALLGHPVPHSRPGWSLFIIVRLATQPIRSLLGGLRARDDQRRGDLGEASQAAERLATCLYFARDRLGMLGATLAAVGLADAAGPGVRLARAYAGLGILLEIGRLPWIARACFRRASAIAAQAKDLAGGAYVSFARGLSLVGFGRWTESDAAFAEALGGFRTLGDRHELRATLTLQGLAAYFTGRLDEAHAVFADVHARASEDGNLQHQAWGLYAMAECELPRGRTARALELLERAREMLARHPDHPSEIICHGLLSLAHLRAGDRARARAAAETGLARIREEKPTVFSTLPGYAGVAETFLALAADDPALLPVAREACRRLKGFARVFPIGRPAAMLLGGRLAMLLGARRSARRSWERGLRAATLLAMPHERALLAEALS
jgi:class 3 adenylate cyclase/tetratricopeptide (TPR) repeat protein